MSGGGKGGVMIALTDKDNQNEVAKAISAVGGHPYITVVGGEGFRVE